MKLLGFVLAFVALVARSSAQSDATDVAPYSYIGCWRDSGNPRALAYQIGTPGGASSATIETCFQACSPYYTYFGLEYHSQCWCANALDASSTQAPHSDCNTPCDGNLNQWCGGPDRLSVYTSTGSGGGGGGGGGGGSGSGGNVASSKSARSYSVSVSKANQASLNSARSYSISMSKANAASDRSARSYSVSVSKADFSNSKVSASSAKSASRDSALSVKSAASASRASVRSVASDSASLASASRASARSVVSAAKAGHTAGSGGGGGGSRRMKRGDGHVDAPAMPVEEAMALVTPAPSLEDAQSGEYVERNEDEGEFVFFEA